MKLLKQFIPVLFITLLFAGGFYSCEDDSASEPDKEDTDDTGDNNDDDNNSISAFFETPTEAQTIKVGESLTFAITDSLYNDAVAVKWTFEGGEPSTSGDKSVSVTYNNKGKYDVTLVVEGTENKDTLTKKEFITVEKTGSGYTRTYTDSLRLDASTDKFKLFKSGNAVDSIYHYRSDGDTVFVKPKESQYMYLNGYDFTSISKISEFDGDYIFTGDFGGSSDKLFVDKSDQSASLLSENSIGFDESKMYKDIDGGVSYTDSLEYSVEVTDRNSDGNATQWTVKTPDGSQVTIGVEAIYLTNGDNIDYFFEFVRLFKRNSKIYGIFEYNVDDVDNTGLASFKLLDSDNSKNVEFGGFMKHWDDYNGDGYPNIHYYKENLNDVHYSKCHFIDYNNSDYSITNVKKGVTGSDQYDNNAPYFMFHVSVSDYEKSGYIKLLDDASGNETQIKKVIPYGEYVYVINLRNSTHDIIRFDKTYLKNKVDSDLSSYNASDNTYTYLDLTSLPSGVSNIWDSETISGMYDKSGWMIKGSSGGLVKILNDGTTNEPTDYTGGNVIEF
jgi:plastocyanin